MQAKRTLAPGQKGKIARYSRDGFEIFDLREERK